MWPDILTMLEKRKKKSWIRPLTTSFHTICHGNPEVFVDLAYLQINKQSNNKVTNTSEDIISLKEGAID